MTGTGEGHQAAWGKGCRKRQEKLQSLGTRGSSSPRRESGGAAPITVLTILYQLIKISSSRALAGGLFLQLTEERQENSFGLGAGGEADALGLD